MLVIIPPESFQKVLPEVIAESRVEAPDPMYNSLPCVTWSETGRLQGKWVCHFDDRVIFRETTYRVRLRVKNPRLPEEARSWSVELWQQNALQPISTTSNIQGMPVSGQTAIEGSGVYVGPASLDHDTAAADEWRAGLAPERARFSTLGSFGAPTAASRLFSQTLASKFDCRICHALIKFMWQELPEPSGPALEAWMAKGCAEVVRRKLVEEGWQLTDEGCHGAGYEVDGKTWCMLQDFTSEVFRRRELCEIYEPKSEAMYLACERTIGKHSRTVAAYLVANRNGTLARARNEHLAYRSCIEAAYCGQAVVPAMEASWCTVPTEVNHATSCAGQRIEPGGTCYPTCLPGYTPTVNTITCSNGYLIPSVFACHPDTLSTPPLVIRTYDDDVQ
jgi:hypothetical protein